ncbi:hypothetical protein [Streptomyces acidiscabies]|uniref:hypothetical protein n=1 Tax=Streptomyces acidiscabies TaxID=42234 RepID=UPI0009529129|nr:hypothetical protein [Streptomyces acidiscabies]
MPIPSRRTGTGLTPCFRDRLTIAFTRDRALAMNANMLPAAWATVSQCIADLDGIDTPEQLGA